MNNQTKLSEAATLIKNGNLDESIICLNSLLLDKPKHELALGMLASIYFEQGKVKESRGLYQRLLAINDANPLARFQFGMLEYNNGLYAEALDLWAPMLDDESDYMAHFHSGLALLQLEDTERAEPLLQHANKTMPIDHPLREALRELKLTES